MKRLGRIITYLMIGLLIWSLASSFSQGLSNYCAASGEFYAQQGFDCNTHVNAFLSAYLGNPQTYFFSISLFLVFILFFHHVPYLKPEYWIRIANKPRWWVGKKIFLTTLEVTALFYLLYGGVGVVLGFSVTWTSELLLYPLYLFGFIALVNVLFQVVYVFTEKYVVALFSFFFINNLFFYIIYEIAWLTGGTFLVLDGIQVFDPANDPFILKMSHVYVVLMLLAGFTTLFIILKRKECFK